MAKRRRNAPLEPEAQMGILAVFFAIALVVAFAKVGSGSNRSLADNPSQVRVV